MRLGYKCNVSRLILVTIAVILIALHKSTNIHMYIDYIVVLLRLLVPRCEQFYKKNMVENYHLFLLFLAIFRDIRYIFVFDE